MPKSRFIFRTLRFDTLLMRGGPSRTAWPRAYVRELVTKHGRGGLRIPTSSFVLSDRSTIERSHLIREDPAVRSWRIRAKPGESVRSRIVMRVGDHGGGDNGE